MKIYVEIRDAKPGERGKKAQKRALWCSEVNKILAEGALAGYTKSVRFDYEPQLPTSDYLAGTIDIEKKD